MSPVICFTAVKDVGCPLDASENDTKPPAWPGEPGYLHYALVPYIYSTDFLSIPIMQSMSLSFVRLPFHIHKNPSLYT